MDSALRHRFLKLIDFDFAALELREQGVKRWSTGRADWEINGELYWPQERYWWLDDDPTPVVAKLSAEDRAKARGICASVESEIETS